MHYLKNIKSLQDIVLAKARAINRQRLKSPEPKQLELEFKFDHDIEDITRRTLKLRNRRLSMTTKASSSERINIEARISRVNALLQERVRDVKSANSRKTEIRVKLRQQSEAEELGKAHEMLRGWRQEKKEERRALRKARMESEAEARSRSHSLQNSIVGSRLAYRDVEEIEQREVEYKLERFNAKIEKSTLQHHKALQHVSKKARSCSTARDFSRSRRIEEDDKILTYLSKVNLRSQDERAKRAVVNEAQARAKRIKQEKLDLIKQRLKEDLKRRTNRAYELDRTFNSARKSNSNTHSHSLGPKNLATEIRRLQTENAQVRISCQRRAQLYKQEQLLHKHINDAQRVEILKKHREERKTKLQDTKRLIRESLLKGTLP